MNFHYILIMASALDTVQSHSMFALLLTRFNKNIVISDL